MIHLSPEQELMLRLFPVCPIGRYPNRLPRAAMTVSCWDRLDVRVDGLEIQDECVLILFLYYQRYTLL